MGGQLFGKQIKETLKLHFKNQYNGTVGTLTGSR